MFDWLLVVFVAFCLSVNFFSHGVLVVFCLLLFLLTLFSFISDLIICLCTRSLSGGFFSAHSIHGETSCKGCLQIERQVNVLGP